MAEISKARLLELADEKLSAGRILLATGHASDAYYLFGYASELTLKALIVDRLQAKTMPDPLTIKRLYTHDLRALIHLAQIDAAFTHRRRTDTEFDEACETVLDWNEASRYSLNASEKAMALFAALTDNTSGVLPWIRSFL